MWTPSYWSTYWSVYWPLIKEAAVPTGCDPTLPLALVDTTYATPSGSTIAVGNGGDFAAALTAANPGDLIVLNAGSTYTGTFTLPVKSGSTYIYVVSSDLSSLPAAGTRVSASDASRMPRVNGPSPTEPAVVCAAGAHHFRFVGINFTSANGVANNGLVRLGTGSETATNQFPHHIVLDRCYIHGDAVVGGLRGVLLAGNFLAVIDSYVSDWKLNGTQTQGIVGWTGEGPWKIRNNYIEAAGENLLVGGSDPLIASLIPSDIEVRGNLMSKPLAWNPFDPSWDSSSWDVANILELKNARRVLITENTFEHNWVDAQSGRAILFTTKSQDGVAPWTEVRDITFTDNVLSGSHSGFSISGDDGGFPSAGGQKILIQNNYLNDIGGPEWGEDGSNPSTVFAMTGGMPCVTINHNTVIHGPFAADGSFMIADGAPYLNFTLTNNIWENNTYGIKGPGTAQGNDTIAIWFPGSVIQKNVMVGASPAVYPPDNFFPSSIAEVDFVEYPTDVRLAASSPYVGAATDGDNPGAFDSVLEPPVDVEIVAACMAFRLFKQDCEMEIKGWGSTGPYQQVSPFGGPHQEPPSGAEI